MKKLKPVDLEIGDIVEPIFHSEKYANVSSYGKVVEILPLFSSEMKPIKVVVVDVYACRDEDNYEWYEQLKLTDDFEYNLVWRDLSKED